VDADSGPGGQAAKGPPVPSVPEDDMDQFVEDEKQRAREAQRARDARNKRPGPPQAEDCGPAHRRKT